MNYLALDDEKGVERHYKVVITKGANLSNKEYCARCAFKGRCWDLFDMVKEERRDCAGYEHCLSSYLNGAFGIDCYEDSHFEEIEIEDKPCKVDCKVVIESCKVIIKTK